jgi:protease-4
VKAVVLRIDSGGGSALASELIWHAVAEIKAKKPVVVSMSDVAASGGYYIAAGATKIYALEDTLTGSIGVVGGKLAPGAALARLGVTTYPRGRGKRSTMSASLGPWNADERATVQAMMTSIYDVFVGRVADGRGKTRDEIHAIAQGRVWTGADARRLGLVDELGGLEAALAEARKLGGLPDDATIEEYPSELTLRDFMSSFGAVQLPYGMTDAVAQVARELSPEAAVVVERTLRQLARFRDSRVQAVAFLPIVFR